LSLALFDFTLLGHGVSGGGDDEGVGDRHGLHNRTYLKD
jgi:hypothetical protein